MAVYEYKLCSKIEYIKKNQKFIIPFSEERIERIIDMWSNFRGGVYFNSPNIRLENISTNCGKNIITISYTEFYCLLITNIIRLQIPAFEKFVLNKYKEKKDHKIIAELKEYYSTFGEYNDFESIIKNGNMANAIAVSVQVIDRFGNAMLVKRSGNVAIGKELYSVTATGALDSEDWETNDPIKSCAARELHEELNLIIAKENFKLISFVMGVNKRQPIAVVNAYVDIDLNVNFNNLMKSSIYNYEISKVHICRISDIKAILGEQNFTEAAEYHLKYIIEENTSGGSDKKLEYHRALK